MFTGPRNSFESKHERLVTWQEMQLEDCRTGIAIILERLSAAGLYNTGSYLIQLHRQRFDAALRRYPCNLDANILDVLHSRELAMHTVEFAGFPSLRSLRATSRIASGRTVPTSEEVTLMFPMTICVAGGTDGICSLGSAECYRPSSGAWEELPPMSYSRSGASCSVLSGRLHVWGGFDGHQFQSTAECFDPTVGFWGDMQPLSSTRGGASATVVHSDVYMFGGFDGSEPLYMAEVFKPEAGGWEEIPRMAERRSGATAVCIGDDIYVCGGHNGREELNSAEKLNLVSLTWSALPPMLSRRRDAASVALDGKLYVCGGYDGSIRQRLSSVESFDPATGAWEQLASMSVCRTGAAAVVLKGLTNDEIYILGGFDGQDRLNSVERFISRTGTWEAAEPMKVPRAGLVAAAIRA